MLCTVFYGFPRCVRCVRLLSRRASRFTARLHARIAYGRVRISRRVDRRRTVCGCGVVMSRRVFTVCRCSVRRLRFRSGLFHVVDGLCGCHGDTVGCHGVGVVDVVNVRSSVRRCRCFGLFRLSYASVSVSVTVAVSMSSLSSVCFAMVSFHHVCGYVVIVTVTVFVGRRLSVSLSVTVVLSCVLFRDGVVLTVASCRVSRCRCGVATDGDGAMSQTIIINNNNNNALILMILLQCGGDRSGWMMAE